MPDEIGRSSESFSSCCMKIFKAEDIFGERSLRGLRKKYLCWTAQCSVCIKIFDWEKHKKEKEAIKLHTLLDYDGCMPKYLYKTEGKIADVKHANYMLVPSGSVIVAD